MNFVRALQFELALEAAGHQFVGEAALLIQFGVGLGDDEVAFLDGRQILDLVGNLVMLHLAVGRLHEAVGIGPGVQGERVDQADIRAFGRLDRANPAIVGRVHVADFEAGALARQAARSQSGNAALVGNFGKRVGLVHELRQLA